MTIPALDQYLAIGKSLGYRVGGDQNGLNKKGISTDDRLRDGLGTSSSCVSQVSLGPSTNI